MNDVCDFQFSLYDAASNGNQQGSTQTIANVSVTDGRFSTLVNGGGEFGTDAFMGDARWLEIAVRCPAGGGSFTTLSPRQELTATPYAVYAGKAGSVSWDGLTDVPADIADGDHVLIYTAGAGLTLSSGEFSVVFGGDGSANTSSRSDHTHFGQAWIGSSLDGMWIENLSSNESSVGLIARSSGGVGLVGVNLSTDGENSGVLGASTSPEGVGVSGVVSTTTGQSVGVYGESYSVSGRGVAGYAMATTGSNSTGVYGETRAPGGAGVAGYASSSTGENIGVYGEAESPDGRGVVGIGGSSSGENAGVYGSTNSASGWAGFFDGDVNIDGTLFKSGGAFRIDHPLDPENKYLSHSFVESPDMMNVYNGNVTLDGNGEAWVQLPDWFEALNKDFRYQLTPIGAPGPNLYIAEPVQGNRFKIAGGAAGLTVSWQVTGIRHDPYAEANPIVVEEEKAASEKGTYLTPEAYGQPEEMGARFQRDQSWEYQSEPAAKLLEHMKAQSLEQRAGE